MLSFCLVHRSFRLYLVMFADYFFPSITMKTEGVLKIVQPPKLVFEKNQNIIRPKYHVSDHARCQCWDGLRHSRTGEEKQVNQGFVYLLFRKCWLHLKEGPHFHPVQYIPLSGHSSLRNGNCIAFLGGVAFVRPVVPSVTFLSFCLLLSLELGRKMEVKPQNF